MSVTVGVLGAGQLGRMLALAGLPLGLNFRFFDPDPNAPCGAFSGLTTASYSDDAALSAFADAVDVITYEFENVPVKTAEWLACRKPVFPPPRALEVSQDRVVEKQFFGALGIATAPYAVIDGPGDISSALETVSLPAILKTRRLGYDGKGQRTVRTLDGLAEAVSELGGQDLILEQFVSFTCECSLLCVRSLNGETAFYPLVVNESENGILRTSCAPSPEISNAVQTEAERHGLALLRQLDYVGILAIEYFLTDVGLIANEMAPRVHNSGHWTINGAETSQFENHLRAITAQSVGSTSVIGWAGMRNIIGDFPDLDLVSNVPGTHIHVYGKSPRPDRKIGHVNVRCNSAEARDGALAKLDSIW